VAQVTYWLGVMFWEEFKAELLNPKLLVLVRLSKSSSAFSITVVVVELWGVQDGRIILVGCGVAHRLNWLIG
jgi:hypothetical protein